MIRRDGVHEWQIVLHTELGRLIDRAILDELSKFLLKKGSEMTLDEIRELKEEIKTSLAFKQAELADLEDEEKKIRKAPPKSPGDTVPHWSLSLEETERRKAARLYFDRLTALLNDLVNSREIRVAFKKEGKWTNLLPSNRAAQESLREIGMSMLLDRIARRAEKEDAKVLIIETEAE